ncbi:hypothetical protein VTN77DRAFT_4120 [Rasamsonia byssochlamydoides]|uniref:uncharacterized protein n=1 Tax=Rasamsonia byssochlamydoides TaxID=89139 RepID=UPI0037447896
MIHGAFDPAIVAAIVESASLVPCLGGNQEPLGLTHSPSGNSTQTKRETEREVHNCLQSVVRSVSQMMVRGGSVSPPRRLTTTMVNERPTRSVSSTTRRRVVRLTGQTRLLGAAFFGWVTSPRRGRRFDWNGQGPWLPLRSTDTGLRLLAVCGQSSVLIADQSLDRSLLGEGF